MKRRTFIIRSKDVINHLVAFLDVQPNEPVLEVAIYEHKKDRGRLQNSLYWVWITIIANELGLTKEDVHEDLKKRLLVPIYERDEPGFSEMIQAVRKVYTMGHKTEAKTMGKQIVKLTSTTGASAKQFTEYLNEIERDMIGKGIVLPHPKDRYYSAMGIRKPENQVTI